MVARRNSVGRTKSSLPVGIVLGRQVATRVGDDYVLEDTDALWFRSEERSKR